MKKKGIIIFDIIISMIVIFGLCFNVKSINSESNLKSSELFSDNRELNWDISVIPEHQRALVGSTVKVKVDINNIDMGEDRNK